MAQKTFRCRLITPTAQVLDDAVTYASVPMWDGLMGVLPGRGALVGKLGLGELRLDFPDKDGARGGSRSYLIEDGFVQMINDKLTILAASATPAESINEQSARAELSEATARNPGTPEESAAVSKARDRARAKVRMARGGGI